MPNRMLRDWTGSEKVSTLTCQAERFFTRLIMKVDDYGCFYADSRLLKANLFPLLLDNIRDADILRWMAECQKAGLIVVYESAGKSYLRIIDFKQRLDRARSKFPLPTDNDSREVVNELPPEEKRSRKEVEVEREPKLHPTIDEVRDYFKQNGYSSEIGSKAWSYYETGGWKDGKGNKVRNWKQKMQSVWFKEENRMKPVKEATISNNNW